MQNNSYTTFLWCGPQITGCLEAIQTKWSQTWELPCSSDRGKDVTWDYNLSYQNYDLSWARRQYLMVLAEWPSWAATGKGKLRAARRMRREKAVVRDQSKFELRISCTSGPLRTEGPSDSSKAWLSLCERTEMWRRLCSGVVTPRSLVQVYWCFGDACCHHQGGDTSVPSARLNGAII
jgi:hypothetical protein